MVKVGQWCGIGAASLQAVKMSAMWSEWVADAGARAKLETERAVGASVVDERHFRTIKETSSAVASRGWCWGRECCGVGDMGILGLFLFSANCEKAEKVASAARATHDTAIPQRRVWMEAIPFKLRGSYTSSCSLAALRMTIWGNGLVGEAIAGSTAHQLTGGEWAAGRDMGRSASRGQSEKLAAQHPLDCHFGRSSITTALVAQNVIGHDRTKKQNCRTEACICWHRHSPIL